MHKDFEEFKEKIHPYYGKGNFSKNSQLFKFIEEKEVSEVELEKDRIELIRPYCSKCKSRMLPRQNYYRCYNCGNRRDFTAKEQSFWKKEEGTQKRK